MTLIATDPITVHPLLPSLQPCGPGRHTKPPLLPSGTADAGLQDHSWSELANTGTTVRRQRGQRAPRAAIAGFPPGDIIPSLQRYETAEGWER